MELIELIDAAEEGDLDLVMELLEAGADIHEDDDGALRVAVQEGHLDVIELLLDSGADIHAEDDLILIYAVQEGHLDVIKLLLDRGANVHARDGEVFILAAREGYPEIVELFLDYGANGNNDEALAEAANYGNLEVVELLEAWMHGEDTGDWSRFERIREKIAKERLRRSKFLKGARDTQNLEYIFEDWGLGNRRLPEALQRHLGGYLGLDIRRK
jgi:hypothetical protein